MTHLRRGSSKKLPKAFWLVVWLFTLVLTALLITWGKASPDTLFFGDSLTEEWPLPTVKLWRLWQYDQPDAGPIQ